MQTADLFLASNGPPNSASADLAVLISGGLDSAILLGESLRRGASVKPLYIRSGLYWEPAELDHLEQFLEAVRCAALKPLQVLDVPVAELYGTDWSMTGQNVPQADSADDAVFLPGRNVLLLVKAMLWCHLHSVRALALGLLQSNPFPDATPGFLKAFQDVVNEAVGGGTLRVHWPFAGLSKVRVLKRGRGLPLELTFSCIRPVAGIHCGQCNKCAERRRAFLEAGISDATRYHEKDACTA